MKKTITKSDGTTEVVEGTPEEIAEYERKLRGEVKTESPKKVPKLLTEDEQKRQLQDLKDLLTKKNTFQDLMRKHLEETQKRWSIFNDVPWCDPDFF